jgi:biotin synthase-related radical SAM superfamily protein
VVEEVDELLKEMGQPTDPHSWKMAAETLKDVAQLWKQRRSIGVMVHQITTLITLPHPIS